VLPGVEGRLLPVESVAPVGDFDVVGFSLQSELNYANVPNMLDLAGLPLLATERGDGVPFVLGGGPCTANPEPVADFFDMFLVGDAEEALPILLRKVVETRNLPRRDRLVAFSALPGIYVPSLYDVAYSEDGERVAGISPNAPGVPERARRTFVERLSPDVYPDRPMVPSVDIVQDRLGLEIMRGCTQGCRFCQAGTWYRPVRELDPEDVARMTKTFIDEAGWSEVGLLSLSSADYSQIEPLVACLAPELAKTKVSISLPSLRAEAFSVALADAVSEVRKSGFTFAPETGSDRLRRVINKTFTNDDMVQAADVAFSRGWDLIKVYTMIGLPTETDGDLEELVTLVRRILAEGRKHGVKPTVHVSVGSFVPKSFTPFQWCAFDGVATLERKLAFLREKLRPVKGAKLKWHEPREAEIESLLSLGDRRMGRALLEVFRRGGRFDGWSEHFSWTRWNEALEAAGVPKTRHLRKKELKETLPWDVVDALIRKPFLQAEWRKALQEGTTEDCKWGHCVACGVPGNGEDTVLASPLPSSFSLALPAAPPPESPVPLESRAATAEGGRASLAAYRAKAAPDLVPLRERRTPGGAALPVPATARTYRLTFEKLGDARYLSHRNTMDVMERALRAARFPLRYTEGYNPHPRMSMGPALPLGQESRHELFDVDMVDAVTQVQVAALNERLPGGIRVTFFEELPKGARSLGASATEAVYTITLPNGEVVRPRLRIAGQGSTTPKRFLEATYGVAPEDQLAIRIVREETVVER